MEGSAVQTAGSASSEVRAVPALGYKFVKWSDGITTPEAAQMPRAFAKPDGKRSSGNFIQREYKEEDFEKNLYVMFDPDEEDGE